MAEEIERKFLVRSDGWREAGPGVVIRQGYLCLDPARTVRVRTAAGRGYLTLKGLTRGAVRAEYEYEIPCADAGEMLERLCERPLIEKTRHRIEWGGRIWEVDEFDGENRGLVVAEVELERPDAEIVLPDWAGPEVTADRRFFNASLVRAPYTRWRSDV
jgi:adenylate cyclase